MQYDIVIVGGGMVGASLACALANTSLRIALIDSAPLNTQNDHRLIALNYGSYCLLNNLNVWPTLTPYAAPIQSIHVSDRGHFGMVRLNADELGLDTLGFVVPAKEINNALNHALSALKSIDILRPAKLKSLIQHANGASLIIETDDDEKHIETALVVGADGTHSTVRQQAGIDTEVTKYHQSALVTITELQRPHQNIAYERFHPNGALAMLPLTGQRVATIWSDTTSEIEKLMVQDETTFLETLQKQFGYRLGRLLKTKTRYVYPLEMMEAKQMIKQHVVLIGNAAHTMRPIAAQGLNLALAEIAMLAQMLSDQQASLLTLNWQSYIDWQQEQQTNSTHLSHQLPRLFSRDFTLMSLVRQLGMLGLDLCPAAKKQFAWRAMGRKGNLPRLLQNDAISIQM